MMRGIGYLYWEYRNTGIREYSRIPVFALRTYSDLGGIFTLRMGSGAIEVCASEVREAATLEVDA
jgi:hypothetical protein